MANLPASSTSRFIAAVDFGSTTASCNIYDAQSGAVVGSGNARVRSHYPEPGHNEMQPMEVWNTFLDIVRQALAEAAAGKAKLTPADITCLGLTVQRNTLMLWDRATGHPLTPFITWRDLRAGEMNQRLNRSMMRRMLNLCSGILYWCSRLKRFYMASVMSFKTGMMSVRLKYLLDRDPALARRAANGQVCAGCMESWLVWKLTAGRVFATDFSCASVSGVYDAWAVEWSGLLLSLLRIPRVMLPEVRRSNSDFGTCDASLFGSPIPIRAVMGDQQAALFGLGCETAGDCKLTLGTVTSLMGNTETVVHPSVTVVYPVIAWRFDETLIYGVEGMNCDTGPTLDWLVNIGLLTDYSELEQLMEEEEEEVDEQLCFVPAFAGLLVPYEDHRAACMWIGIKSGTSRRALVRAALWGIAFQARLLLDHFRRLSDLAVRRLRCDGGISRSDYVMRTLAEVTHVRVEVCATPNAAILGVAKAAGLSAGVWASQETASLGEVTRCEFEPTPELADLWDSRYYWWRMAVKRSFNWHHFEEVEKLLSG